MCVIPLAAVTKFQNPKGEKRKKEGKKKGGPPLLSFIHFVGSGFTLRLVTKPSSAEEEKERQKTYARAKKSRLNRECPSCASRSFFLDLLNNSLLQHTHTKALEQQ
jgi:hypothetical protein